MHGELLNLLASSIRRKKSSLLKNPYTNELYVWHILFSLLDFSEKIRSEETFPFFQQAETLYAIPRPTSCVGLSLQLN
jgi:hypothetical protein